jgi:hypothetical protein
MASLCRCLRGLVVRQAMASVLLGIALGLSGALGLTQVMADLLFQVRPFDPLTYTAPRVDSIRAVPDD